ncbi:HNH endonuclease family protein [Enterococcus phage EFap02]|nr:HNH endonuclease family protein [Enterococcus phage EFap02]
MNSRGYLYVVLSKNNKTKPFTVHHLVAEAFIPNPENKPQVNHIDEDKTNNVVSNLEWMTAKENNNHGTRNLRSAIYNGTKIKAIDIANGEWNEYCSIRECARKLNLSQGNICSCLKGEYRQTGGYIFEKITNEL